MDTSSSRSIDLARIVRTSLELTSAISLEALLHRIVHAAVDLTESESASILLKEDSAPQLRFVAATSYEDQLVDIPVPLEHSIAGAAFCAGAPLLVPDVERDARHFAAAQEATGFKARSLLCVPLRYQQDKIGVLEVENKRSPEGFSEWDVELMTALAAQATVAIQNARTLQALQQAHRRLELHQAELDQWLGAEQEQRKLAEALRQAATNLSSTLDFTELMDRILDQVGLVVPNQASNLMLIEADDTLRVVQRRGFTPLALPPRPLKLNEVPGLLHMRESSRPMIIPDLRQEAGWGHVRPEHAWIRSYAGAPIVVQGQVIGFLSVMNDQPNFYLPKDGEQLQVFCHHAAIAITNAHLYQQARQEISRRIQVEAELTRHRDHLEELVQERTGELIRALAIAENINQQLQTEIVARRQAEEELRLAAITDALTGVYNRRQLFILAQQAFNQACRYSSPLAALMIDVDRFKSINDRYGHAVGDEVLRLLANHLRSNLRAADILGRYGGEEFVVLMPETDLETARETARRLLAQTHQLTLDTRLGAVGFTISIGVAALQPGSDLSVDHLVDRADQAMYAAKQAGRDQVAEA